MTYAEDVAQQIAALQATLRRDPTPTRGLRCTHGHCRTGLGGDVPWVLCPHGHPFCDHCTWEEACDQCAAAAAWTVPDYPATQGDLTLLPAATTQRACRGCGITVPVGAPIALHYIGGVRVSLVNVAWHPGCWRRYERETS
jgi:hypothetical protein